MPIRNSAKCVAYVVAAFNSVAAIAQPAYDPAKCAQIANSLNINWIKYAPDSCEGIETTDGTRAMAQSGRLLMQGTSVSNAACIGAVRYDLTLSADKNSLTGSDSQGAVLNFTRSPTQSCFTGVWSLMGTEYLGYISPDFFDAPAQAAPTPVPFLGGFGLLALVSLVGGAGFLAARRKKD